MAKSPVVSSPSSPEKPNRDSVNGTEGPAIEVGNKAEAGGAGKEKSGKSTSPPQPSKTKTNDAAHPELQQGLFRELTESLAFAFVLAMLFKSFAAEAFVIPTGSMAPTLYGRNKDVVCPQCGFKNAIGASDELDETGTLLIGPRVDSAMCPNCRHLHNVRDNLPFTGDRILVNKTAYLFGEPQRWDVIVFRYPEDMQKNYIKRLVGLPGEQLRIERGDVYSRKGEVGEFRILRKDDPNKQLVLQQTVYDDRLAPKTLLEAGWPEAWEPMTHVDANDPKAAESVDGWIVDNSGWKRDTVRRQLQLEAASEARWIRFRRLVPTAHDWMAVERGDKLTANPKPSLITDFCSYNAYTGGRNGDGDVDDDRYWVGDLTLGCTVDVTSTSGDKPHLTLELNEGVRRYRCRIDINTGKATLSRNDDLAADPSTAEEIEMATAETPVRGIGTYSFSFANVDDRLCLWVNRNGFRSGLIRFGLASEFEAPANRNPQEADLVPAGIGLVGVAAKVSNLLIQRDVYYRAESVPQDARPYTGHSPEVGHHVQLHQSASDPFKWGALYMENSRRAEFAPLKGDEFFAMGDNSPRSQDSRLWSNERHRENRHAVNRTDLIGKAFSIYWPHGIPFLNNGRGFQIMGHNAGGGDQQEADKYPRYVAPFYPQWWRWQRIR